MKGAAQSFLFFLLSFLIFTIVSDVVLQAIIPTF